MNFFLDIPSNKRFTAKIVYLLLLALLTLRVGGAVSHYCFDGLEPPITIHFDNLRGHVEHDGELGHMDVEKQLQSDNLLSKIFELESLLVILALFIIVLLPQSEGKAYLHLVVQRSNRSRNFLPPLRAPPLVS